jgi:FkbM family methyltransferase
MIVVYCFIGRLPSYTVDTIHQLRLFYNGRVYFIINDYESNIYKTLETKYDVDIINYNDVVDNEFTNVVEKYYNKFCIVNALKGREKLFIYAFERFFLLHNLMKSKNLTNVFFVELDNLIYDDPHAWVDQFSRKDAAYMFDNIDRYASGVCYFKHTQTINKLNMYFLHYIQTTTTFLTEMTALYEYFHANKDDVQILPTHWKSEHVNEIAYEHYDAYNHSIFDAAAMGIFIGGIDPHHSGGVLTKGLKSQWSVIDYTAYTFEWRKDKQGRRVPFVWNPENKYWVKINNLHIHSKHLVDCLSAPMDVSILSGEVFQQMCDVYVGMEYKYYNNPKIEAEPHKHTNLSSINTEWDNPKLVFCYGSGLQELMNKLQFFKNSFVLVSHNSDENITDKYLPILENPNVLRWFAQNPCIKHRKLQLLPIGIANEMWTHGNPTTLKQIINAAQKKEDRIYFYFNIDTNRSQRELCKQIVSSKGLIWGNQQSHYDYLLNLSKCKFAINPPGNGIDCHRIWECYYLGVIPILLRSEFTDQLSKCLPCVLLSSWEDFDKDILSQYDTLIATVQKWYLTPNYYNSLFQTIKKCIHTNVTSSNPTYSHVDNRNIPLDYKLDKLINKEHGFYIELGANDGLTQSNTVYFEFYKDWKGILVEPSKHVFEQCLTNRPKSTCFNCACVSSDYSQTEISGDFSGSLMSSVDGTRLSSNNLVRVSSATLESLVDTVTSTPNFMIDLLSLDVEGYELPILKGLNLKKYSPVYLLIEVYDKDYDTILDFMRDHNYTMLLNFSNYNRRDNPHWSGEHNDYLFMLNSSLN